jgi:hypothetical protein
LSVFPHFGSRGFFLPMPRQTKIKPESQGSRLCTSCNKVKLLSQFETFKDGFVRGLCQQCVTLQKAKKTSATPESYLQVLNTQLKSQRLKQGVQYDLTTEDVVDLWETQNGKCALSGVLMTHQRDGTYGDRKKKEFNASIDRINPQWTLRTAKRTACGKPHQYDEAYLEPRYVYVVDKEHS